jgi:hypothetical protein
LEVTIAPSEVPAAPAVGEAASGPVAVPAVIATPARPASAAAPRVAEVTPVAVLMNTAPAAAPVGGGGGPAAAEVPLVTTDATGPVRVLARAPESGGGNAQPAATWPPQAGAARAAERTTGGGTATPGTPAEASGWLAAVDTAFVEPVWDELAGVFAARPSEQPAEMAASLANPVAGAAALGMLLGAYWGGQPADVAPRRRQFFRRL